MPAKQPRNGVDSACQLELFDEALAEPQRAAADPLVLHNARDCSNAHRDVLPTARAQLSNVSGRGTHAEADRAALRTLEGALADARDPGDGRPALVVLASCLGEPCAPSTSLRTNGVSLRQPRDDWLRRLEAQQKSESTLVGYRVAIDDLLDWSETNGRNILTEPAIVDYLHSYQERAQPAEASYYRRFVLLRKFVRWVCRRDGVPDPFLDLDAPPKPRQERDWLTPEEFRRLPELCALEWRDLELGGREPSLLVRCGKGGKSRRQPLAASLARELRRLRAARQPEPPDPVFCGLEGGRLQETILADIIRRAANRARIEKHVTAHTLRHTAATWLRQQLGDARLVAEYLGHADLSTVTRYAHVARDELFEAAGCLEELAAPSEEPVESNRTAESRHAGVRTGDSTQQRRRRRRRRRRGRH